MVVCSIKGAGSQDSQVIVSDLLILGSLGYKCLKVHSYYLPSVSIWDSWDGKMYSCSVLCLPAADSILILAVVIFASG